MKLTIIGTGYVGLVTGACFADVGHQVICVDNNADKVKLLQAGGIPIYEPGLDELVARNVQAGRLRFTPSTREGVENSDIIFIAVRSPRPVAAMREVYTPYNAPIIVTDINSAELIKHAANSFLALKISYINAISAICEASGANVQEVANGMGMDVRIGRRFLDASLGFGGSCFPKDLSAFIKISEQLGYDFRLLKEVQRVHAEQLERFIKKIADTLWVLKEKKIGVFGLAFKQNTDDVRMSPAIDLCHRLQKEGALLRVHDPKAIEKAKAVLKDVTFVADMNAVADGCDALVVATEWPEVKKLDLERARKGMTHPILFDGRNLFDAREN